MHKNHLKKISIYDSIIDGGKNMYAIKAIYDGNYFVTVHRENGIRPDSNSTS
jgi:hypothetical protein